MRRPRSRTTSHGTVDEFDRAVAERISNLERELTARTREIRTLVIALAAHEGRDEDATAHRHLGHHLEDL